MTRPNLLFLILAALTVLSVTPVASAHYNPVKGRWMERDPLGTLVANPTADLLAQQQVPPGAPPSSSDELPWAEMLGRLSFYPQSQYDDGNSLYQYGRSDPMGGVDPAGGPWWTLPLRKALRPIAVGAGAKVGQAIGNRAARQDARRIAQYQARRKAQKILDCESVHRVYHALQCKSCTGISDPVELAKRAACFAAEIAGRRKYLDLRCDYYLPGSLAAPGGSRSKEHSHKSELANKLRAAARCAELLATCGSA